MASLFLTNQSGQCSLCPSIRRLDILPAEIIVGILAQLSSPEDILNCKLVSRKFHRLINANVVNLARPAADFEIKQTENGWEVQIERRSSEKKWQIEFKQKQQKAVFFATNDLIDDSFAFHSLRHFELATIALFGPFSVNGISLLTHRLQFTRQTQIRSVFIENFNFDHMQSTQRLFGQLMGQKCERLCLINCHFNVCFTNCSLLAEHSLHTFTSLTQFRMEHKYWDGITNECFPLNFVLWTMSKMAHNVRHCLRRPLLAPFLWDSIVPMEVSVNRHSADHSQNVPNQFLSALTTFMLNWLTHPIPPSFHIFLRQCPRHFAEEFYAFCDRIGLSHTNLVFSSLSHCSACIQCNENPEKRLFELFSLREMQSGPTFFCLGREWIGEFDLI